MDIEEYQHRMSIERRIKSLEDTTVSESPSVVGSEACIAKASLLNLCETWEMIARAHPGESELEQTLNACSKQLRRLCDKP